MPAAGLTTGLGVGVAGMHCVGMAGMRMNGRLEYSTVAVALSVLIAVAAATAAPRAAVSGPGRRAARGFPAAHPGTPAYQGAGACQGAGTPPQRPRPGERRRTTGSTPTGSRSRSLSLRNTT